MFHEQALWAAKFEDDQADCAVFTQDHKAIAAVDPTAPSAHLGACLAQRGAVLTGGGTSVFSRKDSTVAKVMWGPYLFAGERLSARSWSGWTSWAGSTAGRRSGSSATPSSRTAGSGTW